MRASHDKLWYIQRTGLFQQLSRGDLQRLADLAELDYVLARNALFVPGEPADKLYLLKEGCLRLSRIVPGGRRLTLAYLRPGELFGDLGEPAEAWHESIAEAIDTSTICRFQRDAFEDFLAMFPNVTLAIARRLSLRARRIETRLEDLICRDVRSRILKVLADLCGDFGEMTPTGERLELKLTHQDVADLVGATRETTTTALGELLRTGQLALEGKLFLLTTAVDQESGEPT